MLHNAEEGLDPIGFHADTNHDEARTGRRTFHHGSENARNADAFKQHGGAALGAKAKKRGVAASVKAIRRDGALQSLVGRFNRRVDDDIRAHFLCQGAAPCRKIRRNNRCMAMQLECGDGRQPDRAAANHQRHFGIIHAEMFHRMNANRHRFR